MPSQVNTTPIFRGVSPSGHGGYTVSFRDKHVATYAHLHEAIAARRELEQEARIRIIEGKAFQLWDKGAHYRVRVCVEKDGNVWLFASDLFSSIGYLPTAYSKFTHKLPGCLWGLVHINHGKRAYRALNIAGALSVLELVQKDTSMLRQWILLYVIPATLLTAHERLTSANYALSSVLREG